VVCLQPKLMCQIVGEAESCQQRAKCPARQGASLPLNDGRP
jgi:hypothetical protein